MLTERRDIAKSVSVSPAPRARQLASVRRSRALVSLQQLVLPAHQLVECVRDAVLRVARVAPRS
jgi:hypothetical protein